MGPVVNFESDFFQGKRVFVTGDSGFKGSWLSLLLWWSGAEVTGYSLPPYTQEDHFVSTGLDGKIHHVDGDLGNFEKLSSVFREAKPEIVFHLAAQPLVRLSYKEPMKTFQTNIQGSVNLLDCVRQCDSVRSLVYVTSDKCYKNKEWIWGYRETDELGGHDPYSASKAAAEIVFESYRLSYFQSREGLGSASVRAGNVIGGGDWSEDRIIPDCIRSLEAGMPINIRNPGATRPWQHVLEPVVGYMQLSKALFSEPARFSGTWNIGPSHGSHKSVLELATAVVQEWGSGSLSIAPSMGAPHEAGFLHLNCDKIRNYLGWVPVWGFQETIHETVRWYKAENRALVSMNQIESYLKAKERL
jgi:CDP-glucose 4,6-dehydratase